MTQIIVSIIIPAYQCEKYIYKCLTSVLSQSFKKIEVIVIDDGSRDNTWEICKFLSLKDNRIKVYRKKNGGVSSARNYGLNIAKGKWIVFIDADDFIDKNYVSNVIDFIDQQNVEFIHCGFTEFTENGIIIKENKFNNFVGDDFEFLINNFRGLVCSKFYLNDIINGENPIRFDENMMLGEDMVFTIDYLARIHQFCFINESGYFYRKDNSNSLTHVNKRDNFDCEYRSFCHLYNSFFSLIKEKGIEGKKVEKRLKNLSLLYLQIIYSLYRGNYSRKYRYENLKKVTRINIDGIKNYLSKFLTMLLAVSESDVILKIIDALLVCCFFVKRYKK